VKGFAAGVYVNLNFNKIIRGWLCGNCTRVSITHRDGSVAQRQLSPRLIRHESVVRSHHNCMALPCNSAKKIRHSLPAFPRPACRSEILAANRPVIAPLGATTTAGGIGPRPTL
jgi:hypothetical protein